jgi:hypothetical protein
MYYSLHSWYSIVCLLILDGLFIHCVNNIYLRFRELNKIAIQHSKEKTLISCVDITTNLNTFNKHNNTIIMKIHLIQRIHHELYILATKVFILYYLYYNLFIIDYL